MEISLHSLQQQIWEQEHKDPLVLPQMAKKEASRSIEMFWSWLNKNGLQGKKKGIEMGSGKGRNCLWLSEREISMMGFDFSQHAIKEAKKRAREKKLESTSKFVVHDATKKWPWKTSTFDIGIDCFASTDIESSAGREFARNEMRRVLKKEGYLMVYTLSTDDEFHKAMIKKHPGPQKNSFLHPQTKKFEKVMDETELRDWYSDWKIVEWRRIEKDDVFLGKKYHCRHFWAILTPQKKE